jgi:hypothetical protein
MAQTLDLSKLALTGEAFPVSDTVGLMSNSNFLNAMVSQRTLIVRETGLANLRQVMRVSREGKTAVPLTEPGTWGNLRVSPNGALAAFDH